MQKRLLLLGVWKKCGASVEEVWSYTGRTLLDHNVILNRIMQFLDGELYREFGVTAVR